MGKRRLRVVGLLSLSVLVTSCGLFGGGEDPSSPPPTSPSSPPPSSSGQGSFGQPVAQKVYELGNSQSHVIYTVSVYGVYRQGEWAVLQFGLQASGDTPGGRPYDLLTGGKNKLPSGYENAEDSLSAGGVTLVDVGQKKVYLTALDAETGGSCLCPSDPKVIEGPTSVGTVTFKAPPAETKTVDVAVGLMGYFNGVPVTDGAPATPSATAPQPGSSVPPVLPMENASDDEPVRADVLDLDTPTANLDLSVTQKRDRVTLAGDVLFEFDKATLKANGQKRIAEAAAILREQRVTGEVKVNGYTDSKGSNSYNLALSKRRAETVKKTLTPLLKGTGITLVTKGYGEADPVAKNQTEDGKDNPGGRKLNRRVEIVFSK